MIGHTSACTYVLVRGVDVLSNLIAVMRVVGVLTRLRSTGPVGVLAALCHRAGPHARHRLTASTPFFCPLPVCYGALARPLSSAARPGDGWPSNWGGRGRRTEQRGPPNPEAVRKAKLYSVMMGSACAFFGGCYILYYQLKLRADEGAMAEVGCEHLLSCHSACLRQPCMLKSGQPVERRGSVQAGGTCAQVFGVNNNNILTHSCYDKLYTCTCVYK